MYLLCWLVDTIREMGTNMNHTLSACWIWEYGSGAFEDSFYDYCRKWFEEVNRGGAFEVNIFAVSFFLCVDMNIDSSLTKLLQVQSS